MSNLTTKQVEQEWPAHTSNEELAESFASHFQGKIDKIRDLLKNKPLYSPEDQDAPELKCFAPMTQDEVGEVISSLKSKSCELDPIPTAIFKVMLPKFHLLSLRLSMSLWEKGSSAENGKQQW